MYTNPAYTRRISVADGNVTATFNVEILAAIESEEGWPRVTVRVPAMRITTHSGYDESDPIIIRKRDYHVDDVVTFRADYEPGREWSSDFRHYGARGYRKDNGGTVEYATSTRVHLANLVILARDAFVAESPDWARDSVVRLLTKKIERADEEASELRSKADSIDAAADKLRAELGAL